MSFLIQMNRLIIRITKVFNFGSRSTLSSNILVLRKPSLLVNLHPLMVLFRLFVTIIPTRTLRINSPAPIASRALRRRLHPPPFFTGVRGSEVIADSRVAVVVVSDKRGQRRVALGVAALSQSQRVIRVVFWLTSLLHSVLP